MSQQIASMFGALGFKVDTTGLELFKSHMQQAKSDMVSGARATNILAQKFRSLNSALEGVVSKLDKVAIKKANQNIAGSYKDVADSVALIDKALMQIANRQPTVTKAFGKIHSSLTHGNPLWQNYLKSVRDVKVELANVHSKMSTLRANSNVRLRVTGAQGAGRPVGSTTAGGTQTSFSRPNYINPQQGMFGVGGAGGGFFRSMFPAVALAGGLPSAGYAVKEVVQRGRDQQRMENILLFSSKGLEDFNDSLAYVRKEALRLGLDSAELGRAFAQVNMSAGDKLSKDEKKKMFTDMSEFIMTTGAGKEDQKLIFKAINQMFSLGRIQAEELNQLTERGIPRAMIYDTAMEIFGVKSHAEVMKLQEAGKLDPAKLLPEVFKRFAEKAHSSGAFAKMQESSQTKQNIAVEKFNQLSQQIMEGGLDAALGKLFDLLSQIITLLSDVVAGFKHAKDGVQDFTDGNGVLITVLGVILMLLLRKRKAINGVTKGTGLINQAFYMLFRLFSSRGFSVLMGIVKRFGWIGVAITGVTYLLKKLGEAAKGRELGQWTWLDTLGSKFEILKLRIMNLWYDILIMKQNFGKKWFSSWSDDQVFKISKPQIHYDHSPALNNKPPKRLIEKSEQGKQSMSDVKRPSITDYISQNVGNSSQPSTPNVKNDIKVFINNEESKNFTVTSQILGG